MTSVCFGKDGHRVQVTNTEALYVPIIFLHASAGWKKMSKVGVHMCGELLKWSEKG